MGKRFRIERHAVQGGEVDTTSAQLDYILRDLRGTQTAATAGRTVEDAIALWSAVEDIQRSIDVTRTEISALRARDGSDLCSTRTAAELEAVVSGTEGATEEILTAAESIDALAQDLAASEDEAARSKGEAIAGEIVNIYEACNFQDLTGQRIKKVVQSLAFIEERIQAMVAVWKEDAEGGAAEESPKDGLLNGPSLAGDANVVDQDQVDALLR